jgi:hypothetical protein
MTDEQLQRLIDHKVAEAVRPHEQRWESLRTVLNKWVQSAKTDQQIDIFGSILLTMDDLEKTTEPRRKLPTDPRRVKP